MGVKFKNQMNNKSLYNRFFNLSCVELPLVQSFKPNHDPRTKNRSLNLKIYRSIFFYFMNKEQATSDGVQAKNSQAKRGALINFFYS